MSAAARWEFREVTLHSRDGHRLLERTTPRRPVPGAAVGPDPAHFHESLPGYSRTPLQALPAVAAGLGLERLWVKDESTRFELPAFKILGASWASFLALCERCELDPGEQSWPFERLGAEGRRLGLRLVAATDGNHGRAVARSAGWFGCGCRILVPAGMAAARIRAIESEGASVEVCEGSYDDAVEAARALADDATIVVADTSWEGYTQIPRWVSGGYATIFREVDGQLAGEPRGPDVVFVQVGVGALASAAISHYVRGEADDPLVVVVEPLTAACAFASAEAGRPRAVPGPHPSVMAGLNCGNVSPVARPFLDRGVSAYLAISDEAAEHAVRQLAAQGVGAGETGAASFAGLSALCREASSALGGREGWSRALVLVTEGVTDPLAHERSLAGGSGDRDSG